MKYKVTITKTERVTVEIDAPSVEEAESEAIYRLDRGKITFDDPIFWLDNISCKVEAVK